MIDVNTIRAEHWSPALGADGEIVTDLRDIDQALCIILNTLPGTDPLRPLFGCDAWRWIDAPIDVALPNVVRDVREAIRLWEPRVELLAVTLAAGDHEAHWRIRVRWRPVDSVLEQFTEVSYAEYTA